VGVAKASSTHTASVCTLKGFPVVLPMLNWLFYRLDD